MPGDVGFRVATAYVALGVDDSTIEDAIVEAVSDACSAAGAVGGDILIQQLVAAASHGGDELADGLIESVSGAGDAMGADIGASLASALSKSGAEAGDEIGQGILESTSGIGDTLAGQLGDELTSGAEAAGAEAGEGIADAVEGPISLLGSQISELLSAGLRAGLAEVDADVSALMDQLPSTIDPHATYAGLRIGAALAGGLAGMGALAAAAISGALTAAAIDAGAEAGGAGGSALASAIGDSASSSARPAVARVGDAVEAAAVDAMTQAGAAAGDSLASGIGDSAAQSADEIATRIGEAVQASLETTMTEAGAAGGDALAAGLESAAGRIGDAGGTLGAEFATSFERDAEAGAEEAGAAAGSSYARGWSSAALAGIDPIEMGIGTTGRPFPGSAGAAAQAQAAAAAAAQQEAEEIAAAMVQDEQYLQEGIDNFLSLGGQALDEWLEQVQLASESSTSAFIQVYESVNAQLEATTALTDEQSAALELMYYRASTEMSQLQAEAIAFDQSIKVIDFNPNTLSNPLPAWANISGDVEKSAPAVESALAGVGSSAEKTAASFGGMGAMMSGPAMMGMMGISALLPVLSSLFDSNSVSAADFTSAVSQDSDAVGDNTASTIQSALAKSNLNDMSTQLGVSQATLIEYAAGETDAQNQVTSAVNSQTEALNKSTSYITIHGQTVAEAGTATDNLSQSLSSEKQRLDAVTTAVQGAIKADAENSAALLAAEQTTAIYNAAVNALGESMLQQVESTKMSNQATAEYGAQVLFAESSVSYMTQAMGAAVATNRESALTSAYASVALLGLGTSQTELNAQLSAGEAAYTEATGAAGAYSSVLTSLNGTAMSVAEAQNTLAGDMVSAKATFDSNSDSLKLNTQAGVSDREALVSASQAIVAMGVAQYQSSGNINEANQTIQQQIDAYVNATGATGKAKQAIESYLDSITKIPANVSTTVHANTTQAFDSLNTLQNQINAIQATGVHVAPQELDHHAAGGIAQAGKPAIFGEEGPEIGIPTSDMQIIPARQTAQILSGAGGGGASPTFNFYGTQYPTGEQMAVLKREFASSIGAV